MFAFIFGIACLFGLKWALRGGRCGSYRRGYRGRRGPWRRRGHFRSRLWDTLEYLDTSPGQEKVIRAEIGKIMDQAYSTKRAWRRSGDHIARAMRGEAFDESAMAEAAQGQNAALDDLRQAVTRAMARVHEVLDQGQRERLAEIFESGLMGGEPFGGPYRGWS